MPEEGGEVPWDGEEALGSEGWARPRAHLLGKELAAGQPRQPVLAWGWPVSARGQGLGQDFRMEE